MSPINCIDLEIQSECLIVQDLTAKGCINYPSMDTGIEETKGAVCLTQNILLPSSNLCRHASQYLVFKTGVTALFEEWSGQMSGYNRCAEDAMRYEQLCGSNDTGRILVMPKWTEFRCVLSTDVDVRTPHIMQVLDTKTGMGMGRHEHSGESSGSLHSEATSMPKVFYFMHSRPHNLTIQLRRGGRGYG